jgi:hypothetical protein
VHVKVCKTNLKRTSRREEIFSTTQGLRLSKEWVKDTNDSLDGILCVRCICNGHRFAELIKSNKE